ncbi:unnamed protein product [Symbiodinium sp. CCMP2592]|nr:unnamed protein product [Symbiodinium sp. CCMP2592]
MFFDQSHVRFHHVVPGRVLHVQALCKGGWVNVVNIYQHSWGLVSDQDRLLTKRAAIWEKVRDTFGQIPKGHFLIAGGDLNTTAKPMHPWIGRGMLQKGQISPDAECLEQLVQDFQLRAVNTFGRPTAFSYVHEGYKVHRKSFVDYWLIRQCQSGQSSASLLAGFEVGRWREGGRHLPIVVAVTLRPYHHQVRKTPREWPVWKCKLLQQAVKDHPEKAAEFQAMVQERLEAEIEYQPQFLNDILLQVGKQVFDIQRPRVQPPAWTADAHTNLIKQMWSHDRLMKRRRCLPGTRAILQAWRHQVAFLRLHRAVQKHSRQLRRSHFDQLLTAAERCDQVDGASATFTLIKKWEVKELATFWKEICAGSDGQAPPSHQPRHAYHVSREELLHALQSLKGNKAAPAHCAPHALWQIAAGPVAEFMDVQLLSKWRDEEAEVFEDWSASWLTFLNKANKPGNQPGDLRPISLLEPAGKAMSGIIKQHLMPFLQPWIEDRHLFGYLPNRSPQQALSIVFRHCADARARAKAQGRDLYSIRQGHRRGGCAGGLQVSIDFTQAFDRANRALLNSALLLLKVPDNLRCVIMQWVETTTFHVVQDDAEAKFSSSRGIRQGCRLSPSLWVCISVYLLHLLEQEMGKVEWPRQVQLETRICLCPLVTVVKEEIHQVIRQWRCLHQKELQEEEVSQWPDRSFSFKVFVGFIDPTYAEELKKVELVEEEGTHQGDHEKSSSSNAPPAKNETGQVRQITAEAARQARRVEMTQEWNDEDEELNFVRLCQEFEGLVQGELRRVEEFDISSSDEVEEIEEEPTDGLMEWYQGWWFLETEVERSVRMVSEGDEVRRTAREVDACEVVLDSGADCHVLPMDWAEEVGETSNFEYHLKDAQGKVIPTLPVRQNVTFVFTKESGKKLKITDSAVCGNVTQPLFAVGKMWKLGWGTVNEDGRLWLKKGSVRIPIYFKRLERELKNELKSKEDEDGWFVLNDGTPARFDWFMGKTFDPTGKMKRSGERVLNEVDWKSMDFFECTEIWKDRERVQLGASPQARFEVMVTLLEKGLKEPSDYGLLTNLEELERELAQEGVPMEVTGTSSGSKDKKESEKEGPKRGVPVIGEDEEAYQPELLQLSVGAPWDHQLKALRFKKKRIVPIDDGPGLPRLAVEADKRVEEEKRSEPSPPSDRQGSSSSSSKSSSLSGATPEAMDDESDDDDDDPGEVRTKRKAEDELVPDEMTLEEFQREVAKRNAEEEGEGSPKKGPRVDEGTGEVEERVEKVPRLGDEARGSAARVEYHIRRFAKSEDPEEHGDEYVDLDETQLFLEESREFQSKWNEKVCETEEDLTALAQAHRALQLLEKAGLKLSRDKTVCLLRVEGVQTPHIKRQLIDKTKDGRVLKISPDYILPLKQDHIYLGACITYGDFEHKNMQHRVHAGKVAFQRVRKFLMADKAASMQKRLRLWKAIVIPTVMYSITASGVLPKGFDALRVMLTKQARAIARSPRHRLGGDSGEEVITESDELFWRKVAMVAPAQMVQQRLQAAVERTTELTHHLAPQDVRISTAVREWEQTILQQFKDRCIHSDSVTTVHKCDVCNAEFGDYSSLRAHKAKVHSAERRQTAAPTFDRQRHGVDGMPTCSMCGHKFLRWADLQKHVEGNFCQKHTPDTEASTMVEAKASVWDQARAGTLQLDDISLATVTEELKQEQFMDIFAATMPALREMAAKRAAEQDEQNGSNKRPHLEVTKPTKGKGWGKGRGNRSGNGWGNRWNTQTPAPAPSTVSLEDLQQMMHLVARLLVQQDNEIQMLKMDKQFLLHFETGPQGMVHLFWESAQVWKKAKEAQPPTVDKSLRLTLLLCMLMELEGRLTKMLAHEQTKDNMIKHGWLTTLVPQCAPVGGADGGRHIAFSLINQHERGSSGSDVRAFSQAGGQHGSEGCGRSPSGRTPQAAAPGTSTGGGHGAAASEFVTKTQRQVLGVRLQNNHNVCYINSLALLWAWASSFSNNLEYFAGAATPALRAILTSKGSVLCKQWWISGVLRFGYNGDEAFKHTMSVSLQSLSIMIRDLSNLLDLLVSKGSASSHELTVLRGRLLFADNQVFGRRARQVFSVLSKACFCKKNVKITGELLHALLFFRDHIVNGEPRRVSACKREKLTLFTDASFGSEGSGLGGVLYDSAAKPLKWFAEWIDPCDLAPFGSDVNSGLIYELEIFAAVQGVVDLLKGKSNIDLVLFVDNESALSCLICGRAEGVAACILQKLVCFEEENDINIWCEWVPSQSNPADGPSRKDYSNLDSSLRVRLTALTP